MTGDEQRFFAKVEVPYAAGGCWQWTASNLGGGYGSFQYEGRTQYAHRVAYRWFVGVIADGMEVDHLCRNRLCVNPLHLELVTPRENQRRGTGVSALNGAKTHCVRGHALTPENVYRRKRGGWYSRDCKLCHQERRRARKVAA